MLQSFLSPAPANGTNGTNVTSVTTNTATQTLAWPSTGARVVYDVKITSDVTLTLSGAPTASEAAIALYLRQDTAGGHAVTFPSNCNTVQGQSPTISPAANARDIFEFVTHDGGATIDLVQVGSNLSPVGGLQLLSSAPTPPAAPTVTTSSSLAQVTYTVTDGLTNGAPITSHKFYRGTAAGQEALVGTVTLQSDGTYVDTGLTNGTTYYARFSAVNSAGEGPHSAEVSATPVASSYWSSAGGGAVYATATSAMYPVDQSFTVEVVAQPDALTNGANQIFSSIWSSYNSVDCVWLFFVDASGNLNLGYSDASGNYIGAQSSAPLPSSLANGFSGYKVTVTPNNSASPRTAAFDFATSADGGTTYTALGTTITRQAAAGRTRAGAVAPGITIAGKQGSDEQMSGKFKRAKLTINGVVVSDLNLAGRAIGASSIADAQGTTWTVSYGAFH